MGRWRSKRLGRRHGAEGFGVYVTRTLWASKSEFMVHSLASARVRSRRTARNNDTVLISVSCTDLSFYPSHHKAPPDNAALAPSVRLSTMCVLNASPSLLILNPIVANTKSHQRPTEKQRSS